MKKWFTLFSLILTLGLVFNLSNNIHVVAEETVEDYSTVQGTPLQPIVETDFESQNVGDTLAFPGLNMSKGSWYVQEDANGVRYADTKSDEARGIYTSEDLVDLYVESTVVVGDIGKIDGVAGGITLRHTTANGDSFLTLRIRLINNVLGIHLRTVNNGSWGGEILIGNFPQEVQDTYKTEPVKIGVGLVGQSVKVYANDILVGTLTNTVTPEKYAQGGVGMRWWKMLQSIGSKWYGDKIYLMDSSITDINDFSIITEIAAIEEATTLQQGTEVNVDDIFNITGSSMFKAGLIYEIADSRVVNVNNGKIVPQSLGTTTIKVTDPITSKTATANITVEKGEGPEIKNIRARVAEVKSDQEELLAALTQGVEAVDADLTVDTSEVNANVLGRYNITYTATKDDKTTVVNSFVDIVDTTAPELVLSETSSGQRVVTGTPLTLEDFEGFIVSLTDNYDDEEDIQLTIRGYELIDILQYNVYTVKYTAKDSSGNTTTIDYTFTVYDDIAPVIYGTKDVTHTVGQVYNRWMFDVYGIDNADGKTVAFDVDYGDYQYDKLGTYTVTYIATDKSGNRAEKEITVTVTTTEKPTLEFIEEVADNKIVITEGEDIDLLALFTAKDAVNTDLTDEIEIVGTYDVKKAGTYDLTAKVKDAVNNETTVSFTLVVEEAPTSTLAVILYSVIGAVAVAGIVTAVIFILKKKH